MKFQRERVLENARAAGTDDLLDRVTVFREGMEPEAVALCEEELYRRGVTAAQIAEHRKRHGNLLRDANGAALTCSLCHQPAVNAGWTWHRLWGKLPLFPRRRRWCEVHRPAT